MEDSHENLQMGDGVEMKKVSVAVRIRPILNSEEEERKRVIEKGNIIHVGRKGNDLFGTAKSVITKYSDFDFIYDDYSTQYQIYNDIGRRVMYSCVQKQVNSCVFAYGQTGSGKTYTMMGTDKDVNRNTGQVSLFDKYGPLFQIFPVELIHLMDQWIPDRDYTENGLIPRICKNLFSSLRQKGDRFEVRARFVEIYNDETRDLLTGKKEYFRKGCVRATKKNVEVTNAKIRKVTGHEDLLRFLRNGLRLRIRKATKGNKVSSRSHAVFTIYVRTWHRRYRPERWVHFDRKINLVDLAGSEKYRKKNYAKERQIEGLFINMSLLELGRCLGIAADTKNGSGKKKEFVPVRANVLTLLLKDSLGGVSKTFMIVNVSPCGKDVNESFCTLNYAKRCKNINLRVKRFTKDWVRDLGRLMKSFCKLDKKKEFVYSKYLEYKRHHLRNINMKYSIEDSPYSERYEKEKKAIRLQRSKIKRFLKTKLRRKSKAMVNEALISGLVAAGVDYGTGQGGVGHISTLVYALRVDFPHNFWKFGKFERI